MEKTTALNSVIFDIERFDKDNFYMYLQIPGYKPLLIKNPSNNYIRIFMRKARIYKACLVYGMFWDLYRYLYSNTLLKLEVR